MLEGEFTVWAGEKKAIVSAGESFLITPSTFDTIGVFTEKPARGLVVAAPSPFARLIAAVGTLDETEPSHIKLFERIWADIGDEFFGPPGALLSTATKT